MEQKNNNPSFFDPKTLIAVAAVALTYYGWQTYLTKKYPNYNKPKQKVEAVTTEAGSLSSGAVAERVVEAKSEVVSAAPAAKEFRFNDEKVSFVITSLGMGLKDFTVNDYQDKHNNNIKLGVSESEGLFEMRWAGDVKALQFDLSEQGPGHYVGLAQLGNTLVKRELKYNPKTASFSNTISIKNPTDDLKNGFSLLVPESIHTPESSSFLFPSYEVQDFFIGLKDGKNESVKFSGTTEDISKTIPSASLVAVGSHYFASIILDKSDIIPEVRMLAKAEEKSALAELIYKPSQILPEMSFSEILYAGPKSIDALNAIDAELAAVIDFGFFGFIARPLVYIMKAFHSLVGNWGFAIILLTLLVRLCVLPFNIMSFKSMKAMQKVQPIIQKIREKHKDDPMRLNQEMMAVMKQNGANPLGGCLPMLLQIPIFFALYRVIGSSIELYNSPFVFWITDLSSHDKFYVLPVAMAVFMYIQQKLTPSTMDPTQAKIMTFMPVVFSLFMLQLPSGLTLYMVVSTLFGITQQWFIMREPKAKTAAA